MRRVLLLVVLGMAALPVAARASPPDAAGAGNGAWTRLGSSLPSEHAGHAVETRPSRFRAYALDQRALRTLLAAAPDEDARRERPVIAIAGPDGVERFRVAASPVMEPAL